MLKPGDAAPPATLPDQHGNTVSLADYLGRNVLIFFYPKASTPGCTQQACLLRDLAGQVGDTAIIGISPDKSSSQLKFDSKNSLGYPLLADTEHTVADAFDVWKKKAMYGREYLGIERSAFLIDPTGTISHAWYKISPKETPVRLLEALVR